MSRRSRLFATDEELGKRDDDHKKKQASTWLPVNRVLVRKRRVALFSVALLLLWLFVHNMPDLGVGGTSPPQIASTYLSALGQRIRAPAAEDAPPAEQRSSDVDDAIPHDFEGPVKFFYLAPSLHKISHTMGHKTKNKNVLFAASDLKSAAALLPLACEMGRWGRNYVHVAIMGRDEVSIEDIKRVNGADDATCAIYWHDARPDFNLYRTDKSMEISVAGALGHLETFVHPQAVIVADADHEDYFFSKAIRARSKSLRQTLIEVPRDHPEKLTWLARLEAQSLHAWHTALIDIIVQAPAESSGSLIRLLQSLEEADYDGFIPPRLTVELPHKINDATKKFLDGFDWPPRRYELLGRDSQFVLRRRIPEKRESAQLAALRFIESFYPSSAGNSHVLVLSPQAELSPVFFHYLKFYLLDYRYSSLSKREDPILGISLESPSLYLNGTGPFDAEIPRLRPAPDADLISTPFLWQAPNSNAALYFSDRWVELHSFLSRQLTASHHPRTMQYHSSRRKLVSTKYPAWMELFLDLMRARGYALLYPSQDPDASTTVHESLVIVHNELYQPPEEFQAQPSEAPHKPLPTGDVLTVDTSYLNTHNNPQIRSPNLNQEHPLLRNFVNTLSAPPAELNARRILESLEAGQRGVPPPNPPIAVLPMLDSEGKQVSHDALLLRGAEVTIDYRRTAGGCSFEESKENAGHARLGTAEDLFCIDDSPDNTVDELPSDEVTDYIPKRPQLRRPEEDNLSRPSRTAPKAFGAGGAAVGRDDYSDSAVIAETEKAEERSRNPQALPIKAEAIPLTDGERAELEDWNRKQVKEQTTQSADSAAAVPQPQAGRQPEPRLGKIIYREGDGNVREEPGAIEPTPTARRAFPDAQGHLADPFDGPADTYGARLAEAEGVPLSEVRRGSAAKKVPDAYHNQLAEYELGGAPIGATADRGSQKRPAGLVGKLPIRYDNDPDEPILPGQLGQTEANADEAITGRRAAGIRGKMPVRHDDDPEEPMIRERPKPAPAKAGEVAGNQQRVGIIGKLPIRYDDDPEEPVIRRTASGRGTQNKAEVEMRDRRVQAEGSSQRTAAGRAREEEEALREGRAEAAVNELEPEMGQEIEEELRENIARQRLKEALPPAAAAQPAPILRRPPLNEAGAREAGGRKAEEVDDLGVPVGGRQARG